jgi:hypothetical protein
MRYLFLLEPVAVGWAAVEQTDSSVVVELGFVVEQVDSAAEFFVQRHRCRFVVQVELTEAEPLEAQSVLRNFPRHPIHLLLGCPMLLLVTPSLYYGQICCPCLVELILVAA